MTQKARCACGLTLFGCRSVSLEFFTSRECNGDSNKHFRMDCGKNLISGWFSILELHRVIN